MTPPWLLRAIREKDLDVEEIPGVENNPRILEYHQETSLKATSDETPWCSSFVCAMFEWSGVPSTRSAAAISWLHWGVAIDKGIQGAVVVIKRGELPKAHVGFYWSEDLDYVYVLGGNQSNKVCVKGFPKSDVLGYRVPDDDHWNHLAVS